MASHLKKSKSRTARGRYKKIAYVSKSETKTIERLLA